MAVIHKFRTVLTQFPGAPGINTFYALAPGQTTAANAEVEDFSQQLKAMYETLKSYLPSPLNVDGPSSCDVIDVATGELLSRIPVTTKWSVVGTDTGSNTSRATMAKHRYITDRVHRGRFLAGGIFFGPVSDLAITTSGNIAAAYDTAVVTAYQGLLDIVGDLRLAVWSSPKKATANKPASAGTYGYVQQVGVMPVPAVLRSRRD